MMQNQYHSNRQLRCNFRVESHNGVDCKCEERVEQIASSEGRDHAVVRRKLLRGEVSLTLVISQHKGLFTD